MTITIQDHETLKAIADAAVAPLLDEIRKLTGGVNLTRPAVSESKTGSIIHPVMPDNPKDITIEEVVEAARTLKNLKKARDRTLERHRDTTPLSEPGRKAITRVRVELALEEQKFHKMLKDIVEGRLILKGI